MGVVVIVVVVLVGRCFVGRFFSSTPSPFVKHAPVIAMDSSVVAEHAPVVAGSEAASGDMSFFRSPSHIAPGASSDRMEAGDVPFEVGMQELSLTFSDKDWEVDTTTLIAGDWKSTIDGEEKSLCYRKLQFGCEAARQP